MGSRSKIANTRFEQPVFSYLGLATLYQAEHKYDQAISIYQRVIAIVPDEVEVYRHLSGLYLAGEDLQ